MSGTQLAWLVGLITAVTSSLLGQAELLGEPWRHYVTVTSIIATALSGYMLQRPSPFDPADPSTDRRTSTPRRKTDPDLSDPPKE